LALILDAAGTDVVIIETVGVGQGEVDIVRTADVCVVVLVPGSGDEVQALKAGIMEIADIFVVNQADREGADRLVQAIAANQTLRTIPATEWRPPILKTTATTGEGVPEVWASIGQFLERSTNVLGARQRARQGYRLRTLLSERLLNRLEQALPAGEIERAIDRIAAREVDPYAAVDDLLGRASLGSGSAGGARPSVTVEPA
jgi:LAO/AO transport system kinase